MKNKKMIIVILAVGIIALLGIAVVFKDNSTHENSPQVLQEAKRLAKGKDVEEYVDNAFKMYKKHASTSTYVWEGYKLEDKIIVVGERDNKTDKVIKAWRLTTTDKKALTTEEIQEIEFPVVAGYNKINFADKKGIVLSLNQDILRLLSFMDFNYIYDVAVHEMYHFYVDDMKKYDEISEGIQGNIERHTKFPKEATPRAYRKIIYDNIVLAYENPSEQDLYLGRAKYWDEKWQNEYPEEYNQAKILDIAEGKARYVEYLLCIEYEGISKEEKIEAIKNILHKETEVSESLDEESYKLGFASGVLLDNTHPEWKKEITENPQRPVEILLADVNSVKDETNNFDKILKSTNSQIKKSNKKIQDKIKNLEKAEEDKNIPFLQLNNELMEGSFSTSDFLEYKGKTIVMNFGATFRSDTGNAKIDGISCYILKEADDMYTLPLTMKYKIEDNRLMVEDKGISVDAKVKEIKNHEGRIIYVMQ